MPGSFDSKNFFYFSCVVGSGGCAFNTYRQKKRENNHSRRVCFTIYYKSDWLKDCPEFSRPIAGQTIKTKVIQRTLSIKLEFALTQISYDKECLRTNQLWT